MTSRARPTLSMNAAPSGPPGRAAANSRAEAAGGRDRNLDEEDPFPAVIVADDAAEDRAGDRAGQGGHRPDDGRQRRFLLGEDAQQQHLRERHDRAAEQAEQHAHAEQHAERARQAAQQRADGEGQVAGDEGALRAELLGEPAGQRHRDRLGDRVGGDHPRALGRRNAEVAGDRVIDTLAIVVSSTTRKLPRPIRIAAA